MAGGGVGSDGKNDEIADAPSETEPATPLSPAPPPPRAKAALPPASAGAFRRPSRPSSPPSSTPDARPRASAPNPPPQPSLPLPPVKPKIARPQRPDRPDRPLDPPTTARSDDEAAQVAAHYEPLSEIVDDDDAMIAPGVEADVFTPQVSAAAQAAPGKPHAAGVPKGFGFRRTVIPILLTCGVLLIGIGLLRWLGDADSIFADASIPLSATLCGSGVFLLLVAVLNMLQVKAELSAANRSRA